jgi:DNA-binding NarL/FixJ family response regulator
MSSSSKNVAEPGQPIRIILADSEAIFRVGMNKIFAMQEDLEVVAQTETLAQTLNAVANSPADVILFEAGLSPNPADAISEVGRRALAGAKLIMVTQRAGEQETVDYLRRGVRGILARAVSPELLGRSRRDLAGQAGSELGHRSVSNAGAAGHRATTAAAAQRKRNDDHQRRHPGHEEQRHCPRGENDGAGGQKLSAEDL